VNGESSDLRYLWRAVSRFSVYDLLEPLDTRHIDLYLFADRVVRLPVYGKGLKKVGGYLGIDYGDDVVDGFAALNFYYSFRAARGKRRAEMREQLLRYNQQDLVALVAAADFLRTRGRPAESLTNRART
jgi:predicted RecB family nuclease